MSCVPAKLDALVTSKVLPLLLQCVSQTLRAQLPDGSWGALSPSEETAYAVLTLVSFLSLRNTTVLRRDALQSIHRGRQFLEVSADVEYEHLWIEKITYRSKFLKDTYVQAAMTVRENGSGNRDHLNG
jgi:hypothetical protein